MKDLIVIGGAPGVGKTTISELLAEKLGSFVFDFGILREVHLDEEWSDASDEEEQMTWESLVFILENYKKHGYKNIILNDLQDFRIQQIPETFKDFNHIIFSLLVRDDEELRRRTEGPRDSGWKDAEEAIRWNKKLMDRAKVKGEFKVDNSHSDPDKTVKEIIKLLEG